MIFKQIEKFQSGGFLILENTRRFCRLQIQKNSELRVILNEFFYFYALQNPLKTTRTLNKKFKNYKKQVEILLDLDHAFIYFLSPLKIVSNLPRNWEHSLKTQKTPQKLQKTLNP